MPNGMLLPFYTLQRLRMALNGCELFRFSLSLFNFFFSFSCLLLLLLRRLLPRMVGSAGGRTRGIFQTRKHYDSDRRQLFAL